MLSLLDPPQSRVLLYVCLVASLFRAILCNCRVTEEICFFLWIIGWAPATELNRGRFRPSFLEKRAQAILPLLLLPWRCA
mmetsp:Transcript_1975/g.7364  ORF Transcript_1975/g.7364 Transcript_1975/m.7364 type:complete len:80 (+) Transcript_1975:1049-1288(+)